MVFEYMILASLKITRGKKNGLRYFIQHCVSFIFILDHINMNLLSNIDTDQLSHSSGGLKVSDLITLGYKQGVSMLHFFLEALQEMYFLGFSVSRSFPYSLAYRPISPSKPARADGIVLTCIILNFCLPLPHLRALMVILDPLT